MKENKLGSIDRRTFGPNEDPSFYGVPEVKIVGDKLPIVLSIPGMEGQINVNFTLQDVKQALEQTMGGSFFNNITLIVVEPMAQWGYVESTNPHTIHVNEDGILEVIKKTIEAEVKKATEQGIEPKVTPQIENRIKFEIAKKLGGLLGHERAHAEDFQKVLWENITTGKGNVSSVPESHGPAAEPAAEHSIVQSPWGRNVAAQSWVASNCKFAFAQHIDEVIEQLGHLLHDFLGQVGMIEHPETMPWTVQTIKSFAPLAHKALSDKDTFHDRLQRIPHINRRSPSTEIATLTDLHPINLGGGRIASGQTEAWKQKTTIAMDQETAIRTGDKVRWNHPQFEGGSFYQGRSRGARFIGYKEYSGIVIRHSYGEDKGQHTFTIQLDDGSLKRVKGRNLYPNLISHEPDPNSLDRVADTDKKAETNKMTIQAEWVAKNCKFANKIVTAERIGQDIVRIVKEAIVKSAADWQRDPVTFGKEIMISSVMDVLREDPRWETVRRMIKAKGEGQLTSYDVKHILHRVQHELAPVMEDARNKGVDMKQLWNAIINDLGLAGRM